jgi:hypothetical protein
MRQLALRFVETVYYVEGFDLGQLDLGKSIEYHCCHDVGLKKAMTDHVNEITKSLRTVDAEPDIE